MWETSGGAIKTRRHEKREPKYYQNTVFSTKQKKFYRELNGLSNIPNKVLEF